MTNYQNIPAELTELRQWVIAYDDKKPRNPKNGNLANVTDPNTWGSFEDAVRANAPKIGFVLTPWDPYAIIDLDDKPEKPCTDEQRQLHRAILTHVVSYTERSTSGSGYHIVCKGTIPAALHRDNVEVYNHSRYMIFTGDVVRPMEIVNCQPILDRMYSQMYIAPTRIDYEDQDEIHSDTEIVEMASSAINGAKFLDLCRGEWERYYTSRSEADLALMSMLTFYSPSNEQVKRIFRLTELAQRDKVLKNDKYLKFTIDRCRTTQETNRVEIEEISTDNIAIKPTYEAPAPIRPAMAVTPEDRFEFPSGLIGEVATYIYSSAHRPIKKVALAAALALISGIAGRTYNYSNTGLNQYLVVCADTGSGKEDGAKGIDRLISALTKRIPTADSFAGPANFSSGQAIIRSLDKQKCFFSVMGEFGLTMSRITDPRSSGADKTFHKVLLDLYSKSGWDQFMRPSVYADSDKNTQNIRAPNVTILGDTTPDTFYSRLTTANIADGLLPRFLIFNYRGKRPKRNPNAAHPPSEVLVDKLAALVTKALSSEQENKLQTVGCDEDAAAYLDRFDEFCDDQINMDGANSACKQLWNRAHLKALKLAALLAIGENMYKPIISRANAIFAVQLVTEDVSEMLQNFESGIIAGAEVKRESIILDFCREYMEMDMRRRLSFFKNTEVAKLNIIPLGYLRKRVRSLSEFNESGDLNRTLDNALKGLIAMGELSIVSQHQLAEHKITVRVDAYKLNDKFA